jgi:hypothetical protein
MKTNSKYSKIREEIKRLSQEQRDLKPQRKTVNFTGTRKVTAGDAAYSVMRNAVTLMHLFIAYAIIKGKEPIMPTKKEVFQSRIDGFVKTYSVQTEEAA